MYKRFKELILTLQSEDMKDQKEILNTTINDWMNNEEQIDDICLIGVKV